MRRVYFKWFGFWFRKTPDPGFDIRVGNLRLNFEKLPKETISSFYFSVPFGHLSINLLTRESKLPKFWFDWYVPFKSYRTAE